MAATLKFDLAAALKRSVMKKEPRFIRTAHVDLRGRWKKKNVARQNRVIVKNLKPKTNATSSLKCGPSANQQEQPNILEMLTNREQRVPKCEKIEPCNEHCEKVHDEAEYLKGVLQRACRTPFHRDPWVRKQCSISAVGIANKQRHDAGLAPLDEKDVWNLCTRPDIFLWDPIVIDPAIQILCPRCGARAVRSKCNNPKELHVLGNRVIYIARKYECNFCSNSKHARPAPDPANIMK